MLSCVEVAARPWAAWRLVAGAGLNFAMAWPAVPPTPLPPPGSPAQLAALLRHEGEVADDIQTLALRSLAVQVGSTGWRGRRRDGGMLPERLCLPKPHLPALLTSRADALVCLPALLLLPRSCWTARGTAQ